MASSSARAERPHRSGLPPGGYRFAVLRLRHALRLGREIIAFGVVNRAWWFPLVALVVALAVALTLAGATAAPYTVYTLF